MKTITPSRFRLAVQSGFALFCALAGYRFILFLDRLAAGAPATKPGAVEGFLPISALLGLKWLTVTGQWDPVHPAGLTIFLAVLVMAFLVRKAFCGYVCPVGLLASLLEKGGRRMGLAVIPPRWIDLPLTGLKYLLMGGFLFAVLSMDLRSLNSFITSPFNIASDARMLAFFTDPTGLTLTVLGVLIALGLVVRNAWCRYLCPYGALLGLLSWLSPVCVARDETTCIGCGKCTRTCPAGIRVEAKAQVRTPECIGCGECVGACPVEGCLGFRALGRRIPWAALGAAAVLVLVAARIWAGYAGLWNNEMPPDMLRRFYALAARGM